MRALSVALAGVLLASVSAGYGRPVVLPDPAGFFVPVSDPAKRPVP